MKIRDSGMPAEEAWSTFFDVEAVLDALQVPRVGTIADIGCGYGTFTIPAARRGSARIVALDIDEGMIEALKSKSSVLGLENVSAKVFDFDLLGDGIPENSLDYCMLFNVLHHNRPLDFLGEAKRLLRRGGEAGIIHWKYDASTPRGPSLSIRPKPEDCMRWAIEAGFSVVEYLPDLQLYHYGIRIKKEPG